MAELRRKLAMGLISEGEFRRRGTEAARQYNAGLMQGMNSLRGANQITDRQFVSLSNRLKETGNVGVSSFARIKEELRTLGSSALAQGLGLGGLLYGIQNVSKAAARLMSDLTGLASIAVAFGEDQQEAQRAAQSLAEDGLMTVGDAATSLKNLLAAGFGLDEAVELMNAFRDSAAFGRQASLGFGQAIRGATEGIKNGNSVLVDNAGVTKNLSMMLEEAGYSAQDLMKASTDAGVRQAIFNGILKETAPMLGDAARYSDSAAGAFARMEAEGEKARAMIGLRLMPVTGKLAQGFNTVLIPAIQFVIAVFESLGALLGGTWLLLEQTGLRFGWLFTLIVQKATQFGADALALAGRVPLVGRLLGLDPGGSHDRLLPWLNAQVAEMDNFLSTIQRKLMTFAQVNAGVNNTLADIWAGVGADFAPTVDVGNKPRVTRGTNTTPVDPEAAAKAARDREKAEQDLVNNLAKGVELEIASNEERQRAVELMAMYTAMSQNANLTLEERITAQERAERLGKALATQAEEAAKSAEERRKALVEGLKLQALTATELEELRLLELELMKVQWDSTKTLQERLDAAKRLGEIQTAHRDQLPEEAEDPAQRVQDYLMGNLEGFEAQGWFDELFYGIGTAAEDAALGVADAFGAAFEQMLVDGATVGEGMKTLAKGIAGALTGAVSNFARKKVGENVASAIENVAKGIAAASNPFTAVMAGGYFAAAAKHGLAAAAWAALSGGAAAATTGLTGSGPVGRDVRGSENVGGFEAGRARAKGPEVHVYLDPISANDPAHQKVIYKAGQNAADRYGADESEVFYHSRRAS
jgi:hypothetical protein